MPNKITVLTSQQVAGLFSLLFSERIQKEQAYEHPAS